MEVIITSYGRNPLGFSYELVDGQAPLVNLNAPTWGMLLYYKSMIESKGKKQR